MKKLLSLLLALAMVISMVPSVFATEEEGGAAVDTGVSGGTDVGLWADAEISELDAMGEITLAANDTDGYIYKWTAEEDGNISFAGRVPVEGEDEIAPEFDIIIYNGDNVVSKFDNEYYIAEIDVAAGDVVYAQYVALPDENGAYPEMTIETWGTFTPPAPPAGSIENPIYPEFEWNDAYTEATATVIAPVGTTYYAVYGAGMLLSINGGEPTLLVANGMGRVPAIFTITNEGEAEAEYALKLTYPVGTMSNPEALELGWNDVSLEANNGQGYYYSWIAQDTGVLTAYFGSVTEGVEADIVINNNTTYVNKTLLADGVDNNGLEVSMDVNKGDEISIQIAVMPDAEWKYPAADISWYTGFTYPAGSEQSPIAPEFAWNDEYTEATATVIAPVGTTYYTISGNGMLLSINDGEPVAVTGGMWRPFVFTITNDGEAEAEYALKLWVPVGTMQNPEALSLGWNDVSLEANNDQGYYYSWIAQDTGVLTAYFGSVTEGVEADIVINNNTTYVNKTLLADGVDNNGLEVSMNVNKGDEISIQIAVMPDAEWKYPAAEITWISQFAYPAGSEQNPIDVEFEWNEAQTEATATVVAPVGTTYYKTYGSGLILTINDGEPIVLKSANPRQPAIFTITNDGEAEAEYALKLTYPVGAMENPAALVIGENTADIAGSSQGYYFSWIAEKDGTLSITMPETGWVYVINNMTSYVYGDTQWSDSDPVVNPGTVEVKAGDVIEIMVNTYDPANPWAAPAGKLVITAAFAEPEPEQKIVITKQPESVVAQYNSTNTFTVEATGVVSYRWQVSADGVTFTNCSNTGYKTNTLSIKALRSSHGKYYRCALTDVDGNVVYTEAALHELYNEEIVITEQPVGIVDAYGSKLPMHVEATGVFAYRWQISPTGAEDDWTTCPYDGRGTDTTYIPILNSSHKKYFRCQLTDTLGNITYTDVVQVRIRNDGLNIIEQPHDVSVFLGSPKPTIAVRATGVISYRWELSRNGGETWENCGMDYTGFLSSKISASVLNSRNGYMFRCKMIDADDNVTYTDEVTFTIAKITAQPVAVTAASGTTAQFKVEYAGDLDCNWYYSADGEDGTYTLSSFANSNYLTDTLSIKALGSRNGWWFKCKLIDTEGNVTWTNPVQLTVG